jgi:hypothetical protein
MFRLSPHIIIFKNIKKNLKECYANIVILFITNISVILLGNVIAYIKLRFKAAAHFDIYVITEEFNTFLTVQTLSM